MLHLIDHHRHHQHFAALRARQSELARFGDIGALIEFQHRTEKAFGHHEGVLRALVIEAQRSGPECETAELVLLLSLWPGLDAVQRRLLRYYRHDPDALAADIAGGIATGIARLDLDRVTWIAATLIRNLERDLRRGLVRDCRHRGYDEIDENHVAGYDGALEARLAIHDLERLIGADASVVAAVVLDGESQADVAARLGITTAALRKRHQRALRRLRAVLQV